MKLLTVFDVYSGCAWYRTILPALAAQARGHEVRLRMKECAKQDIEWCDVFQVQRFFESNAVAAIEHAKRAGKLTVYDVDDDLWAVGPKNTSYTFWQIHGDGAAQVMRMCDKVTTTGPDLAKTLSKFNPNVSIIPNALPDDWKHYGKAKHEGLVIGWAGGSGHIEDLEMVEDVLMEVLEARPEVTLQLTGCGDWMEHPRIVHKEPVGVEVYHHRLSECDIAIAPLVDSRFNRAKSDLKPLEYAGCGIPVIASKVGPYKGLDRGVLLAASSKDWRRYLLRLIDSAEERSRIGQEGLAWAQTRMIGKVVTRWERAWAR